MIDQERPVISNFSTITECKGEYLNYYLTPLSASLGLTLRMHWEALGRRLSPGVLIDTLVRLASLLLDNNNFELDDKIYRKKQRRAIET